MLGSSAGQRGGGWLLPTPMQAWAAWGGPGSPPAELLGSRVRSFGVSLHPRGDLDLWGGFLLKLTPTGDPALRGQQKAHARLLGEVPRATSLLAGVAVAPEALCLPAERGRGCGERQQPLGEVGWCRCMARSRESLARLLEAALKGAQGNLPSLFLPVLPKLLAFPSLSNRTVLVSPAVL